MAQLPHKQALENRKPAMEEFWEPSLGIHLQISASPIFNDSNEVVGSVHVIKDVTARKRAEERHTWDRAFQGLMRTYGDVLGIDPTALRAKLERNPAEPEHFKTVHGVGYKLVV